MKSSVEKLLMKRMQQLGCSHLVNEIKTTRCDIPHRRTVEELIKDIQSQHNSFSAERKSGMVDALKYSIGLLSKEEMFGFKCNTGKYLGKIVTANAISKSGMKGSRVYGKVIYYSLCTISGIPHINGKGWLSELDASLYMFMMLGASKDDIVDSPYDCIIVHPGYDNNYSYAKIDQVEVINTKDGFSILAKKSDGRMFIDKVLGIAEKCSLPFEYSIGKATEDNAYIRFYRHSGDINDSDMTELAAFIVEHGGVKVRFV